MLGFAIALLDRIGATMKPFEQNLYERTRDALHTALGATRLESTLAEGARLRLPSAIKLASTLEATDPLTSQRRPTAGAPSG
jgi:hypothetical protein